MSKKEYDKARKRVRSKKEFYKHLTSFITINTFLFLLNMVTSPDIIWFHWPIMGWGIGLVFHYFGTFGFPGTNTADPNWEDREIEKELRRMNSNAESQPEALDLKELQKEPANAKKWEDTDLV